MGTKKLRLKQLHEVRQMDGSAINFRHPPRATKMCKWSKTDYRGREIVGSFRTLCHMNKLNNLALRRFGTQITIIQRDWNTGVAASAGTHDFDATWDLWINGVDPWVQQNFFRANGLAGWMRKPPTFGWHYHGFTLPPREGQSISDDFKIHGFKVGIYVDGGYSTRGRLVTSSQIDDYYRHAYGLSGQHSTGMDRTWFPPNIKETIFDLNEYCAWRAKHTK